ncbi:hypothetical protein [Halostella sp. PRR32]|uniref:DUF7322 domain-containing protein n=1 Tax=Halostella sp. PRR32 TaxID=3098147 RepID=UPI002B1DD43A|nr:hypothetical protein [Halostella sp. PRR32]
MLDDSGDDHEDPFELEEGPPPEEELGPDLPSVDGPDVPSVDVPSVDSEYEDVPSDLLWWFWILVILANACVLAFSLGIMFVAFRGNWNFGGRLILAGGLIAVLAWRVYNRYDQREE